MSIEDKKSSGDPSHPYFDSDPIVREEKGFNTRADQPDPAARMSDQQSVGNSWEVVDVHRNQQVCGLVDPVGECATG